MNIMTRKEARALGLRNYFTGKPCPKGHVTERNTGNGHCKECRSQLMQRWRRENGGSYQVERRRRLKYLYGIAPDKYDELLVKQNGVCAICRKLCVTGQRLSVDHCHETGKVRGLLCHNCNHGIGKFKDKPELLLAAAKYLKG